MKKTINVNLAGRIFYVEEDAYPVLDNYLRSVKNHFAKFADSEEILQDIEARIAEQLMPENKEAQPIVNLESVQNIIAGMGKPEDFSETEQGLPEKEPAPDTKAGTSGKRRLYRDGDKPILGGVASGIAAYFDIDPLWVRLAFIAIAFLGGSAVAIYIVLWIIVPEAETASQKVEMKGDRPTLKAIEQSVKEKILDNPEARKGAHRVGGFIHEVVGRLGVVIKKLVHVALRLIGAAILVGSSIAIVGLILGMVGLAASGTSPYVEFPLRDLFGHGMFYLTVLIAFFAAFVPLVLLLLAGTSLATKKNRFHVATTASLLAVWIIAVASGAALAARIAPRVQEFVETSPEYRTVTTTRTLESFTGVALENDMQVTLQQGSTYSVQIDAVEKEQSRIRTQIAGNVLTVSEQNTTGDHWCIFCIHKRPRITITAPTYSSIAAQNAVSVDGAKLTAGTLALHLANGSRADLNLEAGSVQVLAENASHAVLSGKTTMLKLEARNAGWIDTQELVASTATAEAMNASHITLQATDSLSANAHNGSRIEYTGKPAHIEGNAKQQNDYNNEDTDEPDALPAPSPAPAPALPTK